VPVETFLVTGCAGFIGSHMVRRLLTVDLFGSILDLSNGL